jgi:hypothetical protein
MGRGRGRSRRLGPPINWSDTGRRARGSPPPAGLSIQPPDPPFLRSVSHAREAQPWRFQLARGQADTGPCVTAGRHRSRGQPSPGNVEHIELSRRRVGEPDLELDATFDRRAAGKSQLECRGRDLHFQLAQGRRLGERARGVDIRSPRVAIGFERLARTGID